MISVPSTSGIFLPLLLFFACALSASASATDADDRPPHARSVPGAFPTPDSTHAGRASRESGHRTIERYMLWLFPCNDARFTPQMQRVMDEYVLDRVKANSEIVVVGYTDILGEEKDNRELARKRGENVAKYMKSRLKGRSYASLRWEGMGEDDLYSNELPEGRFYNRTVQVKLVSYD